MHFLLSSILCFALLPLDAPQTELKVVKTFEPPSGSVFLADPHFFDFSATGDLYVLDRNQSKVHRWSKEGKYLGHFAGEGNGPGELYSPRLIQASHGKIWVWSRNGKFSVFDEDGKWIRDFRGPAIQLRRFAVLNGHLLLVAYQRQEKAGETFVYVRLMNDKGKPGKVLKSIKNEMFLRPVEGEDGGRIKAYGPEVDITTNQQGDTWFGFSQEPTLYKVNSKGDIVETKTMTFKTGRITGQEREDFEAIVFPGPDGKLFTLKDMPNLSISYDYDKSYYTHLYLKDNTLAAVLTPVSGNDQHKGYFIGSYYLYDFSSGDVKGRGSYRFNDDTLVLFVNGRAMKFSTGENGEFLIEEVALKSP